MSTSLGCAIFLLRSFYFWSCDLHQGTIFIFLSAKVTKCNRVNDKGRALQNKDPDSQKQPSVAQKDFKSFTCM